MITYSIRKTVFLFATACMLGAAGFGCGGNVVVDQGEGEGASGPGGGGDGGFSSSTGGAGAGPSSGSSNQPVSHYGTPTVACVLDEGKTTICAQGFGDASTKKLLAGCHQSHSQVVDHCPAAGAQGCCAFQEPKFGFIEECVYGGGLSAKEFEKGCAAEKGKFTSSP